MLTPNGIRYTHWAEPLEVCTQKKKKEKEMKDDYISSNVINYAQKAQSLVRSSIK